MGIIACIVAAVKGHKTYAIVMGVWTVIAIILLASGVQYAVAPGAIFLLIAIGMKKEPKEESSNGVSYLQQMSTDGASSGSKGFSSQEEAVFVHNAIAKGSSFDEAKEEYRRLHPVPQTVVPQSTENTDAHFKTEEINDLSCSVIAPIPTNDSLPVTRLKTECNEEFPEERESDTGCFPAVSFCRKCGAKLIDGSLFCNKCGTKIEF